MADYELRAGGVKHKPTGAFIPADRRNRHWRRYLAWLDVLGNTPDPPPPAPPGPPPLPPDPRVVQARTDLAAALTINDVKAVLPLIFDVLDDLNRRP